MPQNNLRSDEFDGSSLDTNPLGDGSVPDAYASADRLVARCASLDNGALDGPGTSARNIIVDAAERRRQGNGEDHDRTAGRELRQAAWGLQRRQQLASVHMIDAGGARDFEFIYEDNGNPRNEGLDKLGGIRRLYDDLLGQDDSTGLELTGEALVQRERSPPGWSSCGDCSTGRIP